jgi:hypothetical protein
MNCPRCTAEQQENSRYCSRCGLDMMVTSADESGEPDLRVDQHQAAEEFQDLHDGEGAFSDGRSEGEDQFAPGDSGYWSGHLRLHSVAGTKRPMLAGTLAFFFGPFTYLYLEQSAWFWWGLLGSLILIVLSHGVLIPLLLVCFMLHAYDVAELLNKMSYEVNFDEEQL